LQVGRDRDAGDERTHAGEELGEDEDGVARSDVQLCALSRLRESLHSNDIRLYM